MSAWADCISTASVSCGAEFVNCSSLDCLWTAVPWRVSLQEHQCGDLLSCHCCQRGLIWCAPLAPQPLPDTQHCTRCFMRNCRQCYSCFDRDCSCTKGAQAGTVSGYLLVGQCRLLLSGGPTPTGVSHCCRDSPCRRDSPCLGEDERGTLPIRSLMGYWKPLLIFGPLSLTTICFCRSKPVLHRGSLKWHIHWTLCSRNTAGLCSATLRLFGASSC